MPSNPPCPSCSSTGTVASLTVKDHSVSREDFAVLSCQACGLLFTAGAPGPEAIASYYASEEYVSHTDTRKGAVNRLYHAVRDITIRGKRRMALRANGGVPGALLDYGCGTGAFAAAMRDAGWSVRALEPDRSARENASRIHGLEVGEPSELADIPPASFDVITLWHVLEHVHDLRGTLRLIRRSLKPGGTLFIAVPNHLSLDARVYGTAWAAWDVPRHLYHFSPGAMAALLRPFGLSVTATRNMWFDSFYVSMLSEKYLHGRVRMLPAVWNGLRSNARALLKPGTCSSLVYVVKATGAPEEG